jgi:hypothetical protein
MTVPAARSGVRLAELLAVLSLASDLGMDQPMEHVLRQCLLSLRLAECMGLDGADREVVYYAARSPALLPRQPARVRSVRNKPRFLTPYPPMRNCMRGTACAQLIALVGQPRPIISWSPGPPGRPAAAA